MAKWTKVLVIHEEPLHYFENGDDGRRVRKRLRRECEQHEERCLQRLVYNWGGTNVRKLEDLFRPVEVEIVGWDVPLDVDTVRRCTALISRQTTSTVRRVTFTNVMFAVGVRWPREGGVKWKGKPAGKRSRLEEVVVRLADGEVAADFCASMDAWLGDDKGRWEMEHKDYDWEGHLMRRAVVQEKKREGGWTAGMSVTGGRVEL